MGSYDYGKQEICRWVLEHFPAEATILDVGACNGKWRELLPGYTMDAVEIFKPYADRLTGYRKVYVGDVFDYWYQWYDLIIFGDVIEHMSVQKAQTSIAYARTRCADMIIAVPFMYSQDEVDGNKWQRHIQDDLTPERFAKRYAGFEPLYHDEAHKYCYYHKAR